MMQEISLARKVVLPVSGRAKTNPKSPLRRLPRDRRRRPNRNLSPGFWILVDASCWRSLVTKRDSSSSSAGLLSASWSSCNCWRTLDSSALPSATSQAEIESSRRIFAFRILPISSLTVSRFGSYFCKVSKTPSQNSLSFGALAKKRLLKSRRCKSFFSWLVSWKEFNVRYNSLSSSGKSLAVIQTLNSSHTLYSRNALIRLSSDFMYQLLK